MIGNPAGFDYEATLAACAQGNRTALRELYEREARWLMGVAMRIVRNRALAEEVLQEAFLQIWRGARTFDRSRGSGRGWISREGSSARTPSRDTAPCRTSRRASPMLGARPAATSS